ncbi:MAG: hypothetical protein U5K43_04775 [Halofilum sp. (in: g-proteobacteria)]|nr:hypothetical protein [Halofilum sp. (in: g-proteobacteria)]
MSARGRADTIAAPATPPGHGGIGVIRVSGPDAATIADAIAPPRPAPRAAALRRFLAADGGALDQGLALWLPGPASYTGEDTLELHGHGGPAVLDALLARVLELGARHARPGEFSERAFLNGRLDLAQAEAVADLIESADAAGARAAMRSLEGAFSERVHALVADLTGPARASSRRRSTSPTRTTSPPRPMPPRASPGCARTWARRAPQRPRAGAWWRASPWSSPARPTPASRACSTTSPAPTRPS